MSLFENMTTLSKHHAENSGSYTFSSRLLKGSSICGHTCGCTTAEQCEFSKPAEPEPAPTVSLYNLLDHSAGQLRTLQYAVRKWIIEIETLSKTPDDNPYYTDLTAWSRLLSDAELQKDRADSEAWAEKTAKEINETL